YSNLISQVNGPYGLTSVLTYTNGQLIKIKDVVNLESQMQYNSSNWLSKLSTPYGTNAFDYYSTNGSTALRVTELGVRKHLFLEGATSTNILPTAPTESISLSNTVVAHGLAQTFDATNFDLRNTVYWGPRQYANLSAGIITSLDGGSFDPSSLSTNDYKKGRLRHWLKNRVSSNPTPLIANVLSLERSPSPNSDGSTEGLLTWYDYEGKD